MKLGLGSSLWFNNIFVTQKWGATNVRNLVWNYALNSTLMADVLLLVSKYWNSIFETICVFRFDYWSKRNPNNVWRGRSRCALPKNVKCFWGVNYSCTEKHVTCFVFFFLVLQTCVFFLAGVEGSRVCYQYFWAISVWIFVVRFRLHISRCDFFGGGQWGQVYFISIYYFLLTNIFINLKKPWYCLLLFFIPCAKLHFM